MEKRGKEPILWKHCGSCSDKMEYLFRHRQIIELKGNRGRYHGL